MTATNPPRLTIESLGALKTLAHWQGLQHGTKIIKSWEKMMRLKTDYHDSIILYILNNYEKKTVEEMAKAKNCSVDRMRDAITMEKRQCGPWVRSLLNSVIYEEELI